MRAIPIESRRPYQTTRNMNAFLFEEIAFAQDDQDFGIDDLLIPAGSTVCADIEAWLGQRWKGEEIIRFFLGRRQCYVSRTLFVSNITELSERTI
jgi:hypothetical protein